MIFPHHENEIAQSEAANEKPFANYWLHNGFININNEKMSKSKGNFFTVRDITKHYDYEVMRFFMLSAHYRSPINFSDHLLEQAQSALNRIYECSDNLNFYLGNATKDTLDEKLCDKLAGYRQQFIEAMEDDLNTLTHLQPFSNCPKSHFHHLLQTGKQTTRDRNCPRNPVFWNHGKGAGVSEGRCGSFSEEGKSRSKKISNERTKTSD